MNMSAAYTYLQKSLRGTIVYCMNKGSDKQWNDSLENK